MAPLGLTETSEGLVRALTERVPVGIFVTNAVGECVYGNELVLRLTGQTLEESLGVRLDTGAASRGRRTRAAGVGRRRRRPCRVLARVPLPAARRRRVMGRRYGVGRPRSRRRTARLGRCLRRRDRAQAHRGASPRHVRARPRCDLHVRSRGAVHLGQPCRRAPDRVLPRGAAPDAGRRPDRPRGHRSRPHVDGTPPRRDASRDHRHRDGAQGRFPGLRRDLGPPRVSRLRAGRGRGDRARRHGPARAPAAPRVSGLPRSADGSPEPGAPPRSPEPGARTGGAVSIEGRRHADGRRQLQAGERHPRPRGRRRAPGRDLAQAAPGDARGRHRCAARRRRVRVHPRGHHRRTRRGRRRRADHRRLRPAVPDEPRRRADQRQPRHRDRRARRRRRRAPAKRRHRHVRGQGDVEGRLRAL